MFLGRNHELDKLNAMYQRDKFEMAVVYGRRRVGKTTLLNYFVKDKPAIFMSSLESSMNQNLVILSQAIYAYLDEDSYDAPVYATFQKALSEITRIAKETRIVFIIDEYPYLAGSYPAISSMLQNTIDHEWKETKLFLILCGSSMSFMEEQVLGYQSPLYGRRTAQFKISPFDYMETGKWFERYQPVDKAIAYGVLGGIPLYLDQWNQNVSVDENIQMTILDQNAYLYDEPSNLLKQELRAPSTYNAIITAIADGKTKMNEIATTVQIPTSNCTKYLANLISLGIVTKVFPVTENSRKKSIYQLEDNLFRFWYRFVPKSIGSIMTNRIQRDYDSHIKRYLNEYMGYIFEDMAMTYLLHYAQLPLDLGEYGHWWGNDPVEKKEVEIDVMIVSFDKRQALFGECKYKNEQVGVNEYQNLVKKAELFPSYEKKYYYLFSKSGFTAQLKEMECNTIRLITIEDMYHSDRG